MASTLALAVLLSTTGARAGEPPATAVALAQKITRRIQTALPRTLTVAQVTLPAALVPFRDHELLIDLPHAIAEGPVDVLVTLRGRGREARGWVRVVIKRTIQR